MAIAKSRVYTQDDGSKVSFEFVSDGKLIGITKDGKSVNPLSKEFEDLQDGDDALNAYNVNKFGGNINAYEEIIDVATSILVAQHDRKEKKQNNQGFIDNVSEQALAFSDPRDTGGQYNRGDSSRRNRGILNRGNVYAYPLDIDLTQDHFKITKYKYVRPNINQSKSARVKKIDGQVTNVAGDSVIGSEIDGSVILPMPKPTDANAAQWGGSDLTITDLAALQTAKTIDQDSVFANTMRAMTGRSLTGLKQDQITANQTENARRGKLGQNESIAGNIISGGQAVTAQSISKLTGLLGANFDTDVFLARTGGRVLNPNAEMLFQGPVIRDFSFEFQMIARSKKEGEEIREIIRFFKLGMAPKFQNIAFLANPDVFKLEYRNSEGILKTVNRFNPGGLALTALKTDYAPNGYWAAYTDSQPVALKLAMSFTELRPIYHGDQAKEELKGTVGY